jgi:hypothetical protein
MKKLINKMLSIVTRKTKYFQTDFTKHDIAFIKDNPTAKFIWIVREMGTNISIFHTNESLPVAGEQVKYLFGHADRYHILTDGLKAFKNCFDDKQHEFYIVDLKKQTIRKTNHIKACEQLTDHVYKMLK